MRRRPAAAPEAGGLFDVQLGDAWTGYVAAARSAAEGTGGTLGLDAYVGRELVLTPACRRVG
jgi:hypothetical protein